MRIEIYTTERCGFCDRAKSLLSRRGIGYREIDVSHDRTLQAEMIQRSNKRTVPQIFIDDQGIGGSDDLAALDASGELDRLLALSDDARENRHD